MQKISFPKLFLIFLKTGTIAFGGNVALVAYVRKEFCERKKIISDEELLDLTTVGSLLPGPLATNVIAGVGYSLYGMAGAAAALTGILLPAFILICILSHFYFQYGTSSVVTGIFDGLLPGVAAVIAATAWSMIRKNITNIFQVIILLGAGAVIFFLKGFFVTMSIVAVSGLAGYFIFPGVKNNISVAAKRKNSFLPASAVALMFLVGGIIFFLHPVSLLLQELRMLGLTFASQSITLFGGGYVFVPALEKIVVGMHRWLTSKEFADGIALGQVTPGPIAITATFIGYKVAGIRGALVSTIAVFIPPSLIMIVAQQFIDRIKTKPKVESVFRGIRPAVIGMIITSVWVIGSSAPMDWRSLVIFISMFIFLLWKNPDSALVVILSGLFGFLLHLF
ncbi:MAG: chromate efflux transporter [Bacteroidetes bacterium]|nr:chromate efflux transporter [Bacteroidota bacterium]